MKKGLILIGLLVMFALFSTLDVSAYMGWEVWPAYGANGYHRYGSYSNYGPSYGYGYGLNYHGSGYYGACPGYFGSYSRCGTNVYAVSNAYSRGGDLTSMSRKNLESTYGLVSSNPYAFGLASNTNDYRWNS